MAGKVVRGIDDRQGCKGGIDDRQSCKELMTDWPAFKNEDLVRDCIFEF